MSTVIGPAAATGLPNRRTFLRGAVPVAASMAAAPALAASSPEDRARQAWGEFCRAMNELTAGDDGWTLMATARDATSDASTFVHVEAFSVRREPDPRGCAYETRGQNFAL